MFKTLKKAQKGFTIIELLIVIAIIAILALLVLNNFQGAQAKARDQQRTTDVNNMHSKLEEFYNENNYYPETFTAATFPGIDEGSLKDAIGSDSVDLATAVATYPDDAAITAAKPAADATGVKAYKYIPVNCTSGKCTGYVLMTSIEKSSTTTPDPFVKKSLNQ